MVQEFNFNNITTGTKLIRSWKLLQVVVNYYQWNMQSNGEKSTFLYWQDPITDVAASLLSTHLRFRLQRKSVENCSNTHLLDTLYIITIFWWRWFLITFRATPRSKFFFIDLICPPEFWENQWNLSSFRSDMIQCKQWEFPLNFLIKNCIDNVKILKRPWKYSKVILATNCPPQLEMHQKLHKLAERTIKEQRKTEIEIQDAYKVQLYVEIFYYLGIMWLRKS